MNELMQLWDRHPVEALAIFVFICYLFGRKRRQAVRDAMEPYNPAPSPLEPSYAPEPPYKPRPSGLLDHVLFHWSPRDPFTIGDLLRSLICFGASGSGKTSASGFVLGKTLAKNRKIGGLILASKPEDREFWEKIFRQVGRIKDLIIFHPKMPWRMNFIDGIRKMGGDARDVAESFMVIGEGLEQGENSQRDPFWKEQNRRLIHCATEVVLRATGNVTAPDVQRFITEAALTPAQLATPEFQRTFHYRCLKAAHQNCKTEIEKHDFGQAFQF